MYDISVMHPNKNFTVGMKCELGSNVPTIAGFWEGSM